MAQTPHWASITVYPPGHKSSIGARGTGRTLVLPAGSRSRPRVYRSELEDDSFKGTGRASRVVSKAVDSPFVACGRFSCDQPCAGELALRNDGRPGEYRVGLVNESSNDSAQVEGRFAFQGASSAAASLFGGKHFRTASVSRSVDTDPILEPRPPQALREWHGLCWFLSCTRTPPPTEDS